MFSFFRRKKSSQASAQAEVVADIEVTLLRTFDVIKKSADNPNVLQRRFDVVIALAAMTGALHDTYPNFPIEEENIVFALLEANAANLQPDTDGLLEAIIKNVSACPPRRDARINTMMWLIAPKLQSNGKHAPSPSVG